MHVCGVVRFAGRTFSQPNAKIPMHGAYRYYEVAYLAYCTAWELKGRPTDPEESHDRLDNNQGYMFHNTMSRTAVQQAMNQSTIYSRTKHRKSIQDEFAHRAPVHTSQLNTNKPHQPTHVQKPTSHKTQRKKRVKKAAEKQNKTKKARRANKKEINSH